MGNHAVKTKEAAGKNDKTNICYAGISKEDRDKEIKANGANKRDVLPEEYIVIPAYDNDRTNKKQAEELSK